MNTVQLTRRNARLFSRTSTMPGSGGTTATDSVRFTDCRSLLLRCRDMYDRLSSLRARMLRATNYSFGRQWEDYITDPDSPYSRQLIREEDYIKRQGKVPLKYNIMGKSRKAVVGLYRNQKSQPVAVAHDRDEQRLGEMMTIAMQYAYQINDVPELNARLLESCFCTGLFVRSCYFRYNYERQMSDVFIQNENPYMIFFNSDVHDTLLRDLSLIGAIRDMPMQDLIAAFARSENDVHLLADEYAAVHPDTASARRTLSRDKARRTTDFFTPDDPSLCRVYEIWTRESQRCLYCHDTALGEESFRPLSDRQAIDEENARRIQQMLSLGYPASQASLIEYSWHLRTYWYVRYLTPLGHCIMEGESPFAHGSHPFTLGAYPMINGEIFSPSEELIDIQRIINRTLSQIDFMRQNGAKNTLMVDIDAVPDHMTYSDFASEYTRNGSVLFYKAKPGVPLPQQLRSASVAAGDIDVIRLYLQLNEEISGLSGALKGESPRTGTPASLYAQEAQNSSNNIADFIGWFTTCVRSSDTKMMKVIQQYYTDKRYIPIAGKNFSEEAKWYSPEKIRRSEFDITVSEGISTPAYRMAMENILMEALKGGFIDFKTFLEASSAPFADYLLETVKKYEADAAANGMQQGQGLAGQMRPAVEQIQRNI